MLKTQDKIFKLLNYCIYYISGTNLDQLPLQLIMGNYISQYLLGFLLSRVLSMHVRGFLTNYGVRTQLLHRLLTIPVLIPTRYV